MLQFLLVTCSDILYNIIAMINYCNDHFHIMIMIHIPISNIDITSHIFIVAT